MMRKIILSLLVFISFLGYNIKAENSYYQVSQLDLDGDIDNSFESQIFYDYNSANQYRKSLGYLNNYGVFEVVDGQANLRSVTYGIVDLSSNNDNWDLYRYFEDGSSSAYINSYYAYDAFFDDYDGSAYYIKMANASFVAASKTNLIKVIPYAYGTKVSYYYVLNNELMHIYYYRHQDAIESYKIKIGVAPDFMIEDKKYFSYDGKYFYSDFYNMTIDYREGVHSRAINRQPFYNYYQFLPARSQTNYTADTINRFLAKHLNGRESVLYNSGDYFINAQNLYGVNAITTLSIAINESAWGRSNFAIERNNIFGHNALDSNPELASYYNSVEDSIYEHANNWINRGYAHAQDRRYMGSHLGDKNNGINYYYASDPYWGEKNAQYYYLLDKENGFKDYNKYSLAIKTNKENITAYLDSSLTRRAMYLGNLYDYPFIMLEGNDSVLKLQSDTPFYSDRSGYIPLSEYRDSDYYAYNFDKSYFYVAKDNFSYYSRPTSEIKIIRDEGSYADDKHNYTEVSGSLADYFYIDGNYLVAKGYFSQAQIKSLAAVHNLIYNPKSDYQNLATGDLINYQNQNYQVVVPLDISGDGKINSLDIVKVVNHIEEIELLTGAYLKAAQFNNRINSYTIVKIVNYIEEN